MAASVKKFLGHGLYTLREASFYARVPVQTMGRWLYGSGRLDSVVQPEFASEEKLVSFLDLVQSLAIRAIRIQQRVPLQKIRQAMEIATKDFGMTYPFARAHTTFLWGGEIVIRPGIDAQGYDEFVEASGKHRRNRLLTKVVEIYLRDLTFSQKGLASLYRAFKWNGVEINMDPTQYFGEPLMPSRHTAKTLWEASQIEGGLEPAAKAFGVSVEEVEAACRFYDHLFERAAA